MSPAAPPSSSSAAAAKKKKRERNLTEEQQFQRSLAAFSRSNDLAGALHLYQTSSPPHLSTDHFSSLLHICASSPDPSSAAPHAFSILRHMLSSGLPPSESSVASVVRIAAADSGDRAFDLVREMEAKYGLELKLRTCAPALLAYCRDAADSDKAYEVERHMAEKGIGLEEREIRALLKVSAEAGRGEKVYEYLQKLRGRGGCVEEETAEEITRWFASKAAEEGGRVEWDAEKVREGVVRNGGGWHGEGWLGKGKWRVERVGVGVGDEDGICLGCGERLAGADIGNEEAERFAEAIASLASEREREAAAGFGEFQEWLDANGSYEAIVDGANVALYRQNFADGSFSLAQVELVVNELYRICQGKWPLVILHNKRLQSLMKSPFLKETLEGWLSQGVLYATPSGSNDDWYWLYAAVKLKCLLVTNDEMRDHIFELLGSKFVPTWKERHQVRYTFLKDKLKLEMPPAYSIVIQESERGSWHVPLKNKTEDEQSRTWLCITRCPLPSTAEDSTVKTIKSSNGSMEPLKCIQTENENGLGSCSPIPSSSLGKRKGRSPSP